MSVRVIVGLGNPGSRYEKTRHNIGFRVVDALAEQAKASWRDNSGFCAHTASIVSDGNPILLAKPQTYMNDSGRSVSSICRQMKLKPAEVCVVYDEIQIPVGEAKLSQGGGAGGHNGIESLIQLMGQAFIRYRIGVGAANRAESTLTDYVLGPFSEEEEACIASNLSRFVDGIRLLLRVGPLLSMNQINQKRKQSSKQSNESDGKQTIPGNSDI